MFQVGVKAEIIFQSARQWLKCRVINLLNVFTTAADQVMMMRMTMQFVFDASVSQIRLMNHRKLGQQIERPIHGGLVEIRISFADARENFFGGQMTLAFRNDGKNALTLWGQTMPCPTQGLDEFEMLSHNSSQKRRTRLRPIANCNWLQLQLVPLNRILL